MCVIPRATSGGDAAADDRERQRPGTTASARTAIIATSTPKPRRAAPTPIDVASTKRKKKRTPQNAPVEGRPVQAVLEDDLRAANVD